MCAAHEFYLPKVSLFFLFTELQCELSLTCGITNVMIRQNQSSWQTDLTNNSLIFFILTFYEISKEIFTIGFFQSLTVTCPDWHEIIIIFQPTKKRLGNVLKLSH